MAKIKIRAVRKEQPTVKLAVLALLAFAEEQRREAQAEQPPSPDGKEAERD